MADKNPQEKPLWLELRTEYVDANFEKLVTYLHDNKDAQNDKFYTETLNLLRERTLELIQEFSDKHLYNFDECLSKDKIQFYIRLLGVFILTSACRNTDEARSAHAWQLLFLSMICSDQRRTQVIKRAIDTLLCESVTTLGYSWDELHNSSADVLTEKIFNSGHLRSSHSECWREAMGTIIQKEGNLHLYTSNRTETMRQKYAASISIADDRIQVMSTASKKLKQSEQDSVDGLKDFTEDFINELKVVESPKKKLRRYDPQDKSPVIVQIDEVTYDTVQAHTIDTKYERLSGTLTMNSVFNYTMIDCCKFLKKGDYIYVRIGGLRNENEAIFDVSPELKFFITDSCVNCGKHELALSLCHKNGNTMWITENGYIVYTQHNEYEIGQYAELFISNMNPNGYVYADYLEESKDYFVEQDVRRQLFRDFCIPEEELEITPPEVELHKDIAPTDLSALTILLFLQQRQIQHPSKRYQMLCIIGILSKMCGKESSANFVDYMSQYLRCAIYFAKRKYDKLFDLLPDDSIAALPYVQKRLKIVQILRNFDHIEDAELLDMMVDDEDEQLSKLATLVQSGCRLKSVLSEANMNAIKREITKTLSIDDASETDLDEENGCYFGSEDFNKEFKTSLIFPPNNGMRPDPTKQRINVFKTICAFLNSNIGGTLYLGVSDLGYAVGIESDMKFLKAQTIDKYVRYITDEAKKCFGLNIMTYIQIVPMFDDTVVAIQVKPCDYKLVELDGVAYVRVNTETRPMDDETRISILSHKRNHNRDKVENELVLEKAMVEKKCVILHGYRSNHSNDCHDRHVEPFSFAKGRKHVWCYDLESDTVKIFSISRIGNVEILDDESWTHSSQHKELQMDLFHMTGQTPTKVTLSLDTMARNLLVEEFEGSDRELTQQKDGSWLLETEIYNMAGIGRFVIGLIEHIDILNAPGLKEYIQQFLDSAVKKVNPKQ